MDDKGGDQDSGANQSVPGRHQNSKDGLRVFDGDQQKPMRGQMGDYKGEHNQPADQPKPGSPQP